MSPLADLLQWLERLPNVRERMPGSYFRYMDAVSAIEECIEHFEHCESDAEDAYERRMNDIINYELTIGEEIYDEIGLLNDRLRDLAEEIPGKRKSDISEILKKLLESPVFTIRRKIEEGES
jgi:hypothetical protein